MFADVSLARAEINITSHLRLHAIMQHPLLQCGGGFCAAPSATAGVRDEKEVIWVEPLAVSSIRGFPDMSSHKHTLRD